MRPSQKNRSGRNKSGRKPMGNVVNRVFESAGPEGKVRGTPQQIIEKYLLLARDAQTSSNRVAAENFLQHAEHYIRMLNAAVEAGEERRPQFGVAPRDQDEGDEDFDERGDARDADPRAFAPRASDQRSSDPRGVDPRASDPRGVDPRGVDPRSVDPRASDQRRREESRPPRGPDGGHVGRAPDFAPRRDLPLEAPSGGLETIDPSDSEAPALVPTPEDQAGRSRFSPAATSSDMSADFPAPLADASADDAPPAPAASGEDEPGSRRPPRRRTRRAAAPEAAAGPAAESPSAAQPDPEGALGDAQAPIV